MQNLEKLVTLGTQGNQECTIQRNWQHWVHKAIKNVESRETGIKNVQSTETGNIGYTRQSRMYNLEKLVTLGTQDT